MTDTPTTSAMDRAAMYVGAALIALGTVVLGLVETFVGHPSPVAVTTEAGELIAAPTVPPKLRATLVVLGLLVWGLYGVYRLVAVPGDGPAVTGTAPATE
ncbi:hypothetical protein [Halorientalis halophila]|uniref:hypothetical protein n=1 Tax=Halorientalis halophila TaxID=3108499 RepID=UPI00300A2716